MAKVKLTIILLALFEIAIFFIGYMYIQERTKTVNDSYLARRDELLARQNNLNSLILDLNATLQQEMSNKQALSNELASLSGKSPGGSTTGSGPTPTPPVTTPTPSPPVTRAS